MKCKLPKPILVVCMICIVFTLMVCVVLEMMTTSVIGKVTGYRDRVVEIAVTDCSDDVLSKIFYHYRPNGSIAEGDKLVVPVNDLAWFFSDKDISVGDEVEIEFLLQEIPAYGGYSVLNHSGKILKTGN